MVAYWYKLLLFHLCMYFLISKVRITIKAIPPLQEIELPAPEYFLEFFYIVSYS